MLVFLTFSYLLIDKLRPLKKNLSNNRVNLVHDLSQHDKVNATWILQIPLLVFLHFYVNKSKISSCFQNFDPGNAWEMGCNS